MGRLKMGLIQVTVRLTYENDLAVENSRVEAIHIGHRLDQPVRLETDRS